LATRLGRKLNALHAALMQEVLAGLGLYFSNPFNPFTPGLAKLACLAQKQSHALNQTPRHPRRLGQFRRAK
jgi:hypothetical protein